MVRVPNARVVAYAAAAPIALATAGIIRLLNVVIAEGRELTAVEDIALDLLIGTVVLFSLGCLVLWHQSRGRERYQQKIDEEKRKLDPKIRDEIFEDAATLGGMGFSAHFGQRDGGWFPVTQFRGRFFAVRAGIFESFRHRYAGGGSSFGFPRARQGPGITTALEWHLLPA